MERERSSGLHAVLDRAVAVATGAGTPPEVASEARRATQARFSGSGQRGLARRAEAYFWGVLRRSALRGRAPGLSQSLVAASLAAELVEAGYGAEDAHREVMRVYGPAMADAAIFAASASGGRAA
jgi:hypothetical protein